MPDRPKHRERCRTRTRAFARAGAGAAFVVAVSRAGAVLAHDGNGPEPLEITVPYVPPSANQGALHPLSVVPSFSSLPGAPVKLFLDFVGDVNYDWNGYAPGVTPAYDVDGDATTFSDVELNNIHQICQRVSEKFSPWQVNVTTVDPGNLNKGEVTKVVIGGDGTNGQPSYWAGGKYGGIAWVGGFTNQLPNTVYVFPGNLANGDPKIVAEASSHESGHSYGLNHQSVWSGQTKVAEYNPGTAQKAPIMGKSYAADRGLWWRGASTILWSQIQDDLQTLYDVLPTRVDDHGDDASSATPLMLGPDGAVIVGGAGAGGVIETMPDRDWFSFDSPGGVASFRVDPFQPAGMLDASLFLYSADGTLLGSAASANVLGESLSMMLPAGSYDLVVGGQGRYGDLGQYTISGTSVPEPAVPAILALLSVQILTRGYRRPSRNEA